MSRHSRSAVVFAHLSSAGPSSRPLLRPPHRIASHIPRRPASSGGGLGSYLPGWLRGRGQLETDSADQAGTTSDSTKQKGTEDAGAQGGIFDAIAAESTEAEKAIERKRKGAFKEHRSSSGIHKISPRKLNMLSRQIAGLPVDEAILQMQFSEKAAARWIKSNLALARDHAINYKDADRSKLLVAETWVNKGKFGPARLDIKGRGRYGIKRHPYSRIKFVLKEGKTKQELAEVKFQKDLNRFARSAGSVREDGKLRRKVWSNWAW